MYASLSPEQVDEFVHTLYFGFKILSIPFPCLVSLNTSAQEKEKDNNFIHIFISCSFRLCWSKSTVAYRYIMLRDPCCYKLFIIVSIIRSRYTDWLQAGRLRGRSSSPDGVNNFLKVAHTDSGVHPTSYPMGTGGSFSRG
jgi:hypothetical protein